MDVHIRITVTMNKNTFYKRTKYNFLEIRLNSFQPINTVTQFCVKRTSTCMLPPWHWYQINLTTLQYPNVHWWGPMLFWITVLSTNSWLYTAERTVWNESKKKNMNTALSRYIARTNMSVFIINVAWKYLIVCILLMLS